MNATEKQLVDRLETKVHALIIEGDRVAAIKLLEAIIALEAL